MYVIKSLLKAIDTRACYYVCVERGRAKFNVLGRAPEFSLVHAEAIVRQLNAIDNQDWEIKEVEHERNR